MESVLNDRALSFDARAEKAPLLLPEPAIGDAEGSANTAFRAEKHPARPVGDGKMVKYEGKTVVGLQVNGKPTPSRAALRPDADVLREQLGLTGAKPGCKNGDCGARTVMVDAGRQVLFDAGGGGPGHEIWTVEGLGGAAAVQRGLVEADAFQCGYCTSAFSWCARPFNPSIRSCPKSCGRRVAAVQSVPVHKLSGNPRGGAPDVRLRKRSERA